jgi:hypothetical protein
MAKLTTRAAVLLAAMALVLSGCGTENGGEPGTQSADEQFEAAMAEMQQELDGVDPELPPWEWDADLTGVLAGLEGALDADPDHCRALLTSAFVRLAIVAMDPDIGDFLDDVYGESAAGRGGPRHGLLWFLRRPNVFGIEDYARSVGERQRRDEFPFSQVQEYVEAVVIPALDYADERLTRFEDLGCVDVIYVDTGGPRGIIEIEVDATDAYFVHAPLDLLQSVTHMIVAYNVDVEAGQSWEELIEDDADFLTLRSGGHMPDAYGELLEMAGHLEDATDSLEEEEAAGDPQHDDLFTRLDGLIPLEDEMFLGPGAVDSIRLIAARLEDGLLNGFSVNPAEDTGEPDAPDLDIEIDPAEAFNDPVDDLRDYFPDHAVPWPTPDSLHVFRPVDFPDPTMSDALPTMTDAAWEALIQWMESDW